LRKKGRTAYIFIADRGIVKSKPNSGTSIKKVANQSDSHKPELQYIRIQEMLVEGDNITASKCYNIKT